MIQYSFLFWFFLGGGLLIRCAGAPFVCFEGGCQDGFGKAGYTQSVMYLGNFQKGLPSERGIALLADGSFFDGQWESGRPNGLGSLMLPDRSYYVGKFVNGYPEGKGLFVQYGSIPFSILGKFQKGRLDGPYLLTNDETKEICKGIPVNGQPSGNCSTAMNSLDALIVDRFRELYQIYNEQPSLVWDCYDDCVKGKERIIGENGVGYNGDKRRGLPAGFGRAINRHNAVYIGNWREGKPHGAGHILLSDGSNFLGFFTNGRRDGAGLLVDKSQTNLLLGQWKAGDLEGLYRLKEGNQRECYGFAIAGEFEESCSFEREHLKVDWVFDFN